MPFHALMLLLAIHKNRKRTTYVKENILKKMSILTTIRRFTFRYSCEMSSMDKYK